MSISPAGRRSISADLVRYINPTLGDKMLFASDWAVITPGRRISPGLGIRDEIGPRVLKANARKLPGI